MILLAILLWGWSSGLPSPIASTGRMEVDASQCDAVLALLEKHELGRQISERDWSDLFKNQAHQLISNRARERQRGFSDEEFKEFVFSDTLAGHLPELKKSRLNLERADFTKALNNALCYLPEGTRIESKVYVILKPTFNSFVYRDNEGRLAIFLSLYPGVSAGLFENKATHELFHIGFGQSFGKGLTDIDATRPNQPDHLNIIRTIAHLSEGIAMLAAAGAWNVHPHQAGNDGDRKRWDTALSSYNSDFKRLDQFIVGLIQGTLPPAVVDSIDSAFTGYQGAWYTVGWKMSALIEHVMGRAELVECVKDFKKFIPTYNEAASLSNRTRSEALPLFSPEVIAWLQK